MGASVTDSLQQWERKMGHSMNSQLKTEQSRGSGAEHAEKSKNAARHKRSKVNAAASAGNAGRATVVPSSPLTPATAADRAAQRDFPAEHVTATSSATRPIGAKNGAPRNEDAAIYAAMNQDDKEYIDKTIQEIRSIWHEVFLAEECVDLYTCQKVSWRNCWRGFQSVLSGIYNDMLDGTIGSLPDDSRHRLASLAALLKGKLVNNHSKSVLLSRASKVIQCMEEITEAARDNVSWHMRLNELLLLQGCSDSYHKAQSSVIKEHLHDSYMRLRDVAARAQKIGVGG